MASDRASESQEAHRVYDRYVKPIEQAHEGAYVLVTPAGDTMFAPTLEDVMWRAREHANPENFIFKVGDVALGRL